MWINPEVELPEQLVTAQAEGRLVIFAGAGVSMGTPSNLPSFWELARRIAGDAMPPPERDEPLDRYLGQAENLGVDVQGRAREILDDPLSEPTTLHRDLLALFRSAEDVRLVTTNFDRHFTTSIQQHFSSGVEIYHAPALPLGRDFRGLVYLHGAIERSGHRLILTDGDFGQAYLTDGWATRMLMEMFRCYTVLFVGYSHNDPVMQYLARGLIPGTLRFALTEPGHEDRWAHLGITAVTFPIRTSSDPFGALPTAVSAWVEGANLGTLAHEDRIRELVQASPPLQRDLADYLSAALRDPVAVRFFTKHARAPEWLRWAEDNGAFTSLFRVDQDVTPTGERIAVWFAEHYAVEHAGQALALIGRGGLDLNWTLWNAVCRELALREERPNPSVLSAWAAVLVRSARPGWSRAYLGHLLSACRYPEDRVAAVLLFRHMARPRLVLERPYGDPEAGDGSIRLPAEIALDGEPYYLTEVWKTFFAPRLGVLSGELATLVASHLQEAHAILQATGRAVGEWDPMSVHRSAIEPHEQDRFERHADLLIDAGRDIIEWLMTNAPHRGDTLAAEWGTSDAPLLRRLALHGMTESRHLDPDAALELIRDRHWLYSYGLKHEVFRLIGKAYPQASEIARRQFVAYAGAAQVPTGTAAGDEARRLRDYARYNVAVWLARVAPECPIAIGHLATLQESHPEFGPRPYPDLDHWSGEMEDVILESPVSEEELLARGAAEWLDFLSTYHGEARWSGPTREGLLVNVRSAVRQSAGWGLALATALEAQDKWDGELWECVLDGWTAGALKDDQWHAVLLQIERVPSLDPFGRKVIALLRHGLESGTIPESVMEMAEHLIDRVSAVSDNSDLASLGDFQDWYTVAINRLGGEVAQVWCLALSRHQNAQSNAHGEGWTGIPAGHRARLEAILTSETANAQFGRVVLARHTSFLFSIDAGWTRKHILPLFDWTRDVQQAQQAWHGHLRGGWSDPLFSEMLPAYRQCFTRLTDDLASMREPFCRRLAGAALKATANPLDSGWLPDFMRDAGAEARAHWTSDVGEMLGPLLPEVKQDLWERWVSRYWAARLTGVPRPFTDAEKQGMVEWAKRLGPIFPEAVEKVLATPVSLDEHRLMFYELRTSELITAYPTATARFVEHLLSHLGDLRYECGFVDEAVRNLLRAGAERPVLMRICEAMARLGCTNAAELRTFILSEEGR